MENKPFTAAYVGSETLRHMQRPINISIQKTLVRMREFNGDQEKIKEALNALAFLSKLSTLIDDIREHNKDSIS